MSAVPQRWNPRACAAAGAVAGCVVLAFWTRLQFISMYGRSSYLAWSADHYFGALTAFYVTAADGWRRGQPYRELLYPPGYVAFLATTGRLFGTAFDAMRTVQAAFDTSAAVAVYVIGRAVRLSAAWALVPAVAYAVLPLWAASSTFLLAESLAVPLVLWALVLLIVAARARSAWMPAAAGAWSGLIVLVRPDFALFVLAGALILLAVRHGQRLTAAAITSTTVSGSKRVESITRW